MVGFCLIERSLFMRLLALNLKRILSLALVLMLQVPTQTISSSVVNKTVHGTPVIDPVITYMITVTVIGGNGAALSVPETVEAGQNAVITLTPDIGYHIQSVTDNNVDVTAMALTGLYSILAIEDDHTVVVAYAINEYALAVSVETPMTGLINGEATLSSTLTHGTQVTLTPQPAQGFIFSHWKVNEVEAGKTNPLVLTMDGAKTVVAVFVPEPNLVLAKALVTFFEENTVLGTLTGVAKTDKAQQGKLKAFDNKLKAVVHSLEAGNIDDAIGLLTSTAQKIDGELNPPDFVEGDQSDELAALIQTLITALSPVVPE